jgi:cytochrome c2
VVIRSTSETFIIYDEVLMNRRSKVVQLSLAIVIAFHLSGCIAGVNGQPEPRRSSEDIIVSARGIIASYGCGACHTIPWVAGADAKAAPPLDHFYERSYIAGELSNTDRNLVQWIQDPQKIEPGTAMPTLGVNADEAKVIADYLYHRPNIRDLINR